MVVARGHLVLEARTFSLTNLPDRAAGYFRAYGTIHTGDEDPGPPNACFILEKLSTSTLAGTPPVGVTRWARGAGDTLMVKIAQFPDAGYNAWLAIRGQQLTGRGVNWTYSGGRAERTSEVIQGRRIGPPDLSRCVRAANARAALMPRLPVLPAPRKDG